MSLSGWSTIKNMSASPEDLPLHITNGDSVIGGFREGKIPGSYLSWRDVLHDGPVPWTSTLSDLSDIRARALSEFGCGSYGQIRSAFSDRDQALADFHRHREIILWFEHDLFDQLQLIQLLHWFSNQDLNHVPLSLIEIDEFPGIEPFYGLGQLTGEQLLELFPTRRPVTREQLLAGSEAWEAFRAPDPTALLDTARSPVPQLPFLQSALVRFLEEYPTLHGGLSRTQWQLLRAVASGHKVKHDIYRASQREEECPWGDSSIYWRLDGLASAPAPALERTSSGEYRMNEHGYHLLGGEIDWIGSRGQIDLWLGGVHLVGQDASWRWDPERQTLRGG